MSPMMEVLIGPNRTVWDDYDSEFVEIAQKYTQLHHDLIPYTTLFRSVMVHHTLLTIPFWCGVIYRSTHRSTLQILLNYSPTNLLWAGRPSVLVFFALSGFVLALLFLGRNPTAIDFIGRRIVRIYVPYAGIVSFAILLMALFWTCLLYTSEQDLES